MELYLSRGEILRQARSMLGLQTDNTVATQVHEQHVVLLNMSALRVQQKCAWVNAQGRVTVDLGAEADTLNYPADCGPGAVRAMAVYDEDRYHALVPAVVPITADVDQEQAAGGDTFDAVQGRPTYYEQRNQIKLSPTSDKAYKVRIDYLRRVTMPEDSSVSIVDAMLIIYDLAATIAAQMADTTMATVAAARFEERMRELLAWQSQGTRFAMSDEADMGEEELPSFEVPNWDRSPTARG